MTAGITTPILDGVRAAADAAVALLPSPHALRLGTATQESTVSLSGSAARARFSGSISGIAFVAVDATLAQALAAAPAGGLNPVQALAPALAAAIATVGPVTLGPVEACDVREATTDVIRNGGAIVPLLATPGIQAIVGLQLDASPASTTPKGTSMDSGIDLLRGVEMEVSAELGRARMSLDELLNLGDGAVIELDRAAGAPADLLVNGRLIARGEVVVVDENFGLRITEIITDAAGR